MPLPLLLSFLFDPSTNLTHAYLRTYLQYYVVLVLYYLYACIYTYIDHQDVYHCFYIYILGSPIHSEVSVLKNGAADHIFDILLRFITDSLAPCSDHPLDEVAEKLLNLWPSVAVAVSLMRQILSQSDEATRDSIMQVVLSHPSIFQDLFMAYEIGMIYN